MKTQSKLLKYGCAILCLAWAVIAVILCLYVSDYDRAFQFDKGSIFYTVEEINVHFVQCLTSYPQALLYPDRRFFTLFAFPFVKLFGVAGIPPMLSIRLMNALLSVCVLYLFMAIAHKLKFSAPAVLLSGILLILHPLFVFLSVSTLPDITFVFFLLLSLFLILEKKLLPAAFFASFLPFIRFDGIFVVLLFFLIFAAGGKVKQGLILFIPAALYTITDTLIYHNPLRAFTFFHEQYAIIYTYTQRNALPEGFFSQWFGLSLSVLNKAIVILSLPALFERGLKKRLPEGLLFLLAVFMLGAMIINNVERVPHGRILLPLLVVLLFYAADTLDRLFSSARPFALSAKLAVTGLFVAALLINMHTYKNSLPQDAFRTPHVENPRKYEHPYNYLMDKTIFKKYPFDYVFIDFYSIPEIILLDNTCQFHTKKHYYNGFLLDTPLMEMKSFYYDEKINITRALPSDNGILITKRKPSQMEKFPGARLLKAFEDERMYVYSCCQKLTE